MGPLAQQRQHIVFESLAVGTFCFNKKSLFVGFEASIGVARGDLGGHAPKNFLAYQVIYALRSGTPNKMLLLA